jgi:hypothetical protein
MIQELTGTELLSFRGRKDIWISSIKIGKEKAWEANIETISPELVRTSPLETEGSDAREVASAIPVNQFGSVAETTDARVHSYVAGENPAAAKESPRSEPRQPDYNEKQIQAAPFRRTSPAAPAPLPKMIQCLDCGIEHPENEECQICGPLSRCMVAARQRAKKYHQMKKSQPPKKPKSETEEIDRREPYAD